jgi:TonB family protein
MVQQYMTAFLDHRLDGQEQARVAQHLMECRECATLSKGMSRVTNMLRHVPAVEIPPELASRLQVLASHEREHRLSRISLSARLQYWRSRVKLTIDNLMRPLALPFAGGLVSALCLFGMLVPTLNMRRNVQFDVPIPLYTGPSLEEMAPFTFSNDEMLIEFTVNEKGQITDYSIPHSKTSTKLERNFASAVLFASFTPATLFGQPTSGKVLVSFRRSSSRIIVRG